jgi:hypothetical protein
MAEVAADLRLRILTDGRSSARGAQRRSTDAIALPLGRTHTAVNRQGRSPQIAQTRAAPRRARRGCRPDSNLEQPRRLRRAAGRSFPRPVVMSILHSKILFHCSSRTYVARPISGRIGASAPILPRMPQSDHSFGPKWGDFVGWIGHPEPFAAAVDGIRTPFPIRPPGVA